jgi:hypothetical protein
MISRNTRERRICSALMARSSLRCWDDDDMHEMQST